jgi:hypothetical protein
MQARKFRQARDAGKMWNPFFMMSPPVALWTRGI